MSCATGKLFYDAHGDFDDLTRHYTHAVFVIITLASMGGIYDTQHNTCNMAIDYL